jgi:hypothetical protein
MSSLNTVSAVFTPTIPIELASASNATNVASGSVTNRIATSTLPATSLANGKIVVPSKFNYAVIQTLQTASVSTILYAIGWAYSQRSNLWIPRLLTKVTVTGSTQSGAEVNSLRPGVTYVKNLGDCKIYNGEDGATGACPGGFIVVDVTGCELLELYLVAASGTSNALIGYI